MNAAVGLMDGLGLDGDQCISVIPRQIPYSKHNSIALILCINHLDMPFNVHTTDKVTMITVSGFLTI